MAAKSHWWGLDLTRSRAILAGWKFADGNCEDYFSTASTVDSSVLLKPVPFEVGLLQSMPRSQTLARRGIHDGMLDQISEQYQIIEQRYCFRDGLGVAHPLAISAYTRDYFRDELAKFWKQTLARQGSGRTPRNPSPAFIAAPLAAAIGAALLEPEPLTQMARWLIVTTGLSYGENEPVSLEWTSLSLDFEDNLLKVTPEWFCSTKQSLPEIQDKLTLRASLKPDSTWDKFLVASVQAHDAIQTWKKDFRYSNVAVNETKSQSELVNPEWRQFAWEKISNLIPQVAINCIAQGAATFAAWVQQHELPTWFTGLELQKRLPCSMGIIIDSDNNSDFETTGKGGKGSPYWREIPEIWTSPSGFEVPLIANVENRLILARLLDSNLGPLPRWYEIRSTERPVLILDQVSVQSPMQDGMSRLKRIGFSGTTSRPTQQDWSLPEYQITTEVSTRKDDR